MVPSYSNTNLLGRIPFFILSNEIFHTVDNLRIAVDNLLMCMLTSLSVDEI